MKALSFDQIKKLVHGAASVEEGDGKISFFRFTNEQRELYKSVSTDFYVKSHATSGISLEFETDSENMVITVSVSRGSSRTYFTHSVFVDSKRVGEISGDIKDENDVQFNKTFELGSGIKRVKILFPWSVASHLVSLELDEDAMAVPVHKKVKFLMFGDSITQGYDAMVPENAYAIKLVNHFGAEARNKGIAGEQFFASLSAIKEDFEPDLITVAYGTNDWRHGTKEKFERECLKFFQNLRENYPNTKIIAFAPLWRVDINNEQEFGEPLKYVTKYIKQVGKMVPNMKVIDCMDFIPHRSLHYQTDGVHPIDSGFEHYSRNLLNAIKL